MRHVAESRGIDLDDLYVHVVWPLYRQFGHAFEAFKVIVTDLDSVLDKLTLEVKEARADGQGMTLQPLKIRGDIEVKCLEFDDVLHIKQARRKTEAEGNED